MTSLYGVYGVGGCGRGVMPLLAKQVNDSDAELVFVDDAIHSDYVNGYPVWSWEAFVARPAEHKAIALAVANSRDRERIDAKRISRNVDLTDVISETCVVMDAVDIGPGCVISPFVTITSNIKIGIHFHCNIGSYVEHDCHIGDFVTFAPGVHCNGNIRIDDHVYIGSGAVIRQGTPNRPLCIGRGAVVGMGAVVTSDVEPGTVVAGNPARVLRREATRKG